MNIKLYRKISKLWLRIKESLSQEELMIITWTVIIFTVLILFLKD